jgi:exodeoxyribonuclease V alpha subunit
MQTIDQALKKLANSKFRSSFKLTKKEVLYIEEKGIDVIRMHAADFVRNRLAPANPINDGKQTPMHGHPVFKAMHATACCCRGCMLKWYKVSPNRELTDDEQRRIVNLLIAWIEKNRRNIYGF